jgi:hypothetical protein
MLRTQSGSQQRLPDSMGILTDLTHKVDETFWRTVLRTPVSQLAAKYESAQQETFRCQHEMLDQISHHQTQFITGIKLGVNYSKDARNVHSRLSSLTSLHKSFTGSLSREEFLNLGNKLSLKKDSPSFDATWARVLGSEPKKLSDLYELGKISEKVKLLKDQMPPENTLVSRNAQLLEERSAYMNRHYLASLLCKELAAIPISTSDPEHAVRELRYTWDSMQKLEGVPHKVDVLFALLLNKISKNTIGQTSDGPSTGNYLLTSLEHLVSSSEFCLQVVRKLSKDSSAAAEQSIHLDPMIVKCLQERLSVLLSDLSQRNRLVGVRSPLSFISESSHKALLSKTACSQLLDLLGIAAALEADDKPEEGSVERIMEYLKVLTRQYIQAIGSQEWTKVADRARLLQQQRRALRLDWYSVCQQVARDQLASQPHADGIQMADTSDPDNYEPQDEIEQTDGTHVILDDDDQEEEA